MSHRNSANAVTPKSMNLLSQGVVAQLVAKNSLALLVLVLLIINGGAG